MTATETLERMREAIPRMEACRRELALLEEAYDAVQSWQPRGDGQAYVGGGTSDPTASIARSRMEGLSPAIDRLRADLCGYASAVDEGLAAIADVRRALGERHAQALELYYVDRAGTWSEVARELGVGRSTACGWRTEAVAWLDGTEPAREISR